MLNDTQVKALKPKLKQYKKADREGLYLLIKPNNSKLWRYDYKKDGKYKTKSFGQYPKISLKQAREQLAEFKDTPSRYPNFDTL